MREAPYVFHLCGCRTKGDQTYDYCGGSHEHRTEPAPPAALAEALAERMVRWDDEGDDDVTFQECYREGWGLAEFLALALMRDGWTFTSPVRSAE